MQGITELGYVRWGVSDLAEWREFAESLIGLEVVDEGEDKRLYLRSDNWHHRFILDEDGSDDLIGAGVRVEGAEEFRQMQARLKEAGIAFEVGSDELARDRKVLEVMTLSDPAGNPLEIFHGPLVEPHKPFYPGRRMFGKFVTGRGGAGHMIMRNQGIDKAYEFYKVLGMRGGVEYRIPLPGGNTADLLFMHCNERDHTFAFGPPVEKSIHHFMIEVDNMDDIFMAHELVQASKYPIMTSLGKHANDHMFSFYFQSPSGFMIEYGFSGRPATHQSEYYQRDTYGHAALQPGGLGVPLDE